MNPCCSTEVSGQPRLSDSWYSLGSSRASQILTGCPGPAPRKVKKVKKSSSAPELSGRVLTTPYERFIDLLRWVRRRRSVYACLALTWPAPATLNRLLYSPPQISPSEHHSHMDREMLGGQPSGPLVPVLSFLATSQPTTRSFPRDAESDGTQPLG